MQEPNWTNVERSELERIVRAGFSEDLDAAGDITTRSLGLEHAGRANIVSRSAGVVAGLPALGALLALWQTEFADRWYAGQEPLYSTTFVKDGPIAKGEVVAQLAGPMCQILAVERLTLNLLSRLSGVATLTARYVQAVAGTKARVYDTRKTTPGWRYLEKYAVKTGGGENHRIGLFDAVLIKDNHLAHLAQTEADPVRAAIHKARSFVPTGTIVEVEIDSLTQLESALVARPDIVLLDNMNFENLSLAVELRDRLAPGVALEASGGVNLRTVAEIARSGVDRISVGALTHSAPILDLGLDYVDQPANGPMP